VKILEENHAREPSVFAEAIKSALLGELELRNYKQIINVECLYFAQNFKLPIGNLFRKVLISTVLR
jgi:hypothetical protein